MNRRRVLVGGLGLSALGAVGAASFVRTDPIESWAPSPDTWPLARFGPANTAGNARASAPADPSVAWSTDPGGHELFDVVVGTDAVYVSGRGTTASALDRRTGTVRWSRDGADVDCFVLALRRGTLFAGPGRPSRQPDSTGPVALTAWDARSGELRWRTGPVACPIHIVVADDTVFVGYMNTDPSLSAHDAESGTRRWTIAARGIFNYPVVRDGSLYGIAEDYDLARYGRRSVLDEVLDSAPQPAWRSELSVSPRPPTAVDDLVVYGGSRWNAGAPTVFAVDATDGEPVWEAFRLAEGQADAITPAVVGNRGFTGLRVGSNVDPHHHAVAAVGIGNGSVLWRRRIDQRVIDVAATGDAVVVATTADPAGDPSTPGAVRALDPDDGSERWRIDFDRTVHSIAVVDGAVFATTGFGQVVALR